MGTRPRLRTLLCDYDQGDDLIGVLMAYGIDGADLCRRGLAYYDEDANCYRRGPDPRKAND